jgi:DNA-binding response OmpR family regulator
MTASRILIVEDELHLAEGLLFNLQAEGYDATLAPDGESALRQISDSAATDQAFDAVLLDVMLPGRSGFEVVAELRARKNYIPVLMLTARGRPEDVLSGLEAGADDYLAKPFDLSILLARLKVMLRRVHWQSAPAVADAVPEFPATYEFSGRVIDFAQLELHAKNERIRLTLMEADFLRYLSLNPDRIIPRKELLEQVWRVREDTDTRAIDNFVVRLRRYLEDEPASPVYLKTVRGVGYRFLPFGE